MSITNPKLCKILLKRLRDEGWRNCAHFAARSGVGLSRETIAHVFQPEPARNITNANLAVILWHLNYQRDEIATILRDYTDDDDLWEMIYPGIMFTTGEIDYGS